MINPPTLFFTDSLGISRCKGCGKKITPQQQAPPRNMVFCRRGRTGFLNKLTNKWIEKEGNVHFHINIECLRGRGGTITIDIRHLTTCDDVLNVMDEEHMQVLNELDMLHPIIAQKI